ncbi:MAG: 16S rRNA (cytosine(1402)-N(4))-methyltransferase RsmH [Anaerolineae bacterium]|nr:16S rRNA (cytosine(1402)-N(4))-methyltransferase RsmH [Anaerolineae bacterium]
MTRPDAPHIPVLLDAVLAALRVAERPAGRFVDGTVGAGGHAAAILTAAPDAHLLGLDRDPAALALARARLAPFEGRVALRHASYEQIGALLPAWLEAVGGAGQGADGILLDLGLSSMQVDDPARGFAFMSDGPLDMRFDPSGGGLTAADLVNTWDAEALAEVLFRFGEERHARRIARAIVAARPLSSTRQLAGVIAGAQRGPREKIHPATRTFQALRIAVNDELGAVERALPVAIGLLRPGGRLAVISFHSLEDRIVKQTFKTEATDCLCPPRQPVCTCGHVARVRLVTRKPLRPADEEIAANPRSRSARLRVVERLGGASVLDGESC